ncbi:hypothetical protein CMV_022031 [Castanea mollissima]|uniref:Uncharacterized protein n=1 Tax=Castanea mollissima TaxID=60419 RepID=A0A8J4QK86_9ROSI|nr:hypothetical protein CMV_022031 [Castanea mollissima]
MWRTSRVSKAEGTAILLVETKPKALKEKGQFSLLAKLFIDNRFIGKTMKTTLCNLWSPKSGVKFSHSSLSHSRSAAPEVVVSSGKTTFCYRLHSPVDSHSSLSHSRSAAPDVVASSGRTIVRERCMELYEGQMPQG